MLPNSTIEFPVQKIRALDLVNTNDTLAIEEALEIKLAWRKKEGDAKPVSITMRTPGNDKELAIGFLFTEAIIGSKNEIDSIVCADNSILIKTHGLLTDLRMLNRNFFTNSGCGVCGKTSIDAIVPPSINISI